MKAKIRVGFASRIQAKQFEPVEESDFLELEIDYEDQDDLEKKIEQWQEFIQNKVVKATFLGANKLLAEKARIEDEMKRVNNVIDTLSKDN